MLLSKKGTLKRQEKIASAFCQQKRLADEKLRAVACNLSKFLDTGAEVEHKGFYGGFMRGCSLGILYGALYKALFFF